MKRPITVAAGLAAILLLAACGGGNPLSSPTSAAPADKIVVGSADFTESQLLAEMYAQALAAKGVQVEKRLNVGSREVQLRGLNDGSLDLIPDYSGNLLLALKPDATAASPDEVYAALQQAVPPGLIVLAKSPAQNKDAFVVSQAIAQQYNARSIADIAPNCGQIVFGGPAQFPQRPYGVPGLQKNYNCTFKEFKPLDTGGPLTVAALTDGTVQGADIFTTDPAIKANNFVVLEDPKNNFAAQNILPLIRESKANDTVKSTLDAISAKLTTEGLVDLNAKLAAPDKPSPETVAKEWLTANSLA